MIVNKIIYSALTKKHVQTSVQVQDKQAWSHDFMSLFLSQKVNQRKISSSRTKTTILRSQLHRNYFLIIQLTFCSWQLHFTGSSYIINHKICISKRKYRILFQQFDWTEMTYTEKMY